MSILNLGLQSISLMRTEMNNESEKLMSKCGTMNKICKIAEKNPNLNIDLVASLQTPINLVRSMFDCQFLKDEPFRIFNAASKTEMKRFWETIELVDDSITNEDCTAEHIKQRPLLQKFFEHYCTARHYSFTIKKCSKPACTICHPPRCSPEDFEQLHLLPDSEPGENMYYKSFEELYSKETTENHRPSLKNTKSKKKDKTKSTKTKHTMPFCPSAVRAKNVGIIVHCVELATLHKQPNDTENDDEDNNQENIDVEDNEESEWNNKENEQNEPEDSDNEEEFDNDKEEPKEEELEEEEPEKEEDTIREIFSRVFVNDSWSCASQVKKPYYSAGIFLDVCFECKSPNVTEVIKGELSHCSVYSGNTNTSKKWLR
ncbi:hypothetical protein RclHR1_20330001 [Rhizophagus clarus]|uniref:Uncharacterized protein n=1 Tax=Rhizophagus clarus TaxID=94130 RepID=A0A2Z6QRE1_9GLOM|nr:hypothetical protein RclHR1_20330001 [Rhizophagus clarus]